jgi:fructose-1-phosphate kinase PfkB-like protein
MYQGVMIESERKNVKFSKNPKTVTEIKQKPAKIKQIEFRKTEREIIRNISKVRYKRI